MTEIQLMQVKSVFHRFDENYIFNHQLLTDIFDRMYKKENRLAEMVFIGGAEVVFISLISLLALTVLKISRRTREIGIRKVNGSSVSRIIIVLFKDILIIVLVAIVIASAGAYIVMNSWLADYVQRISLHPGYFLISALFVFAIAIFATTWQAWQAATLNPVKALKHE